MGKPLKVILKVKEKKQNCLPLLLVTSSTVVENSVIPKKYA